MDYFLPLIIKIPEHEPSQSRFEAGWNANLFERYIVVLEERFYQSPAVVTSFCKYIIFGSLTISIVCFILNMQAIALCNSFYNNTSINYSIFISIFYCNFICF